jgi:apolipoprotein N-acyltransferase
VENGAEVVLWCEGVFPADINNYIKPAEYHSFVKIEDYISILAKELGVTIIVGSYVNVDGLDYNTMSAFYPDGDKNVPAYTKMRPVPFGEYLPMREFVSKVVPALTQINYMSNDIYPGKKVTVFDANNYENAIKIGTLICFDSIYETIGIESARAGAEMFIVPSNDSWFYDSRALNMHHSQNILRAVEQGKYTVNCGNTGITSIVNNKGKVISDMPIYEEGYVLDTVYASSGRTLYSYIGNLFVYICVALIFVPFVIELIYKKKNRE